MEYLITLDQDNIPFSIEEFRSQNLSSSINYTNLNKYITTNKKPDFKRLSLTKNVNKIIKIIKNIDEELIESTILNKITKTTINKLNLEEYKLEFKNLKNKTKTNIITKFTTIIKKNKINAKINIKKPAHIIEFIKIENKLYITEKLKKDKQNNELTNNKNLPERHPTATKPKITKAMINISEVKQGIICDPFCGSGGFLIEARKLGLNPIGLDLNKIMLKKARLNCETQITNYKLGLGDATITNPTTVREFLDKPYSNTEKIDSTYNFKINKIDAIVTDMPYGKNSKISQEFKILFSEFLKNYKQYSNTFIIGFQKEEEKDSINFKKLGFKKIFQTEIYIHKSMTKKIIKLKKIE